MQKLHLVGYTTDQNGLILSARRGARSGSYTLVLDDALAEAVEEMRVRQEAEAEAAGRGGGDRVESRLPIGEIQTRLRRGRSLKDVAKDAGVEQSWIERFAAPVFAERAEVIARVQATHYKRARLGPSGMRVGDAVRRNLAERAVVMSPAEYNDSWKAIQRPDGRWMVTFSFPYRGANKTLKFEVRPNGDIVASDQLTSQIAYITPPKPRAARPRPAPVQADDSAKRAVVSTGFRPEPVVKAASRPGKERERAAAAMSKAAAKRAVEGERAAARKGREREQALLRLERARAADAIRRERELAARSREAAAAARLVAAEQAEREKAATAIAAARQAERDAARRAARLKVKAESKTLAAKKTATSKATRSSTAKAAAVSRSARAAERPAARPTPAPGAPKHAKPKSRPRADARVDAPPPARLEAAPRFTPPTAAPTQPVAKRTPPPGPTPRPRPSLGRAAAEVYGTESARPQFREGAVTPAARPSAVRPSRGAEPADAPENGVAPARPPGARRTRPLRAN